MGAMARAEALPEQFNAKLGLVRLVLLVSPT
jgi:hypothetical protein